MTTKLSISQLSDQQLLASARQLARQERFLNTTIIDHLYEIAARKLYVRAGCSSLFDYAVRELGFSEGAAYHRIKAMQLCEEFPEVKQQLQEGALTLTAAGQIQSAFDRHAGGSAPWRGSSAGGRRAARAGRRDRRSRRDSRSRRGRRSLETAGKRPKRRLGPKCHQGPKRQQRMKRRKRETR